MVIALSLKAAEIERVTKRTVLFPNYYETCGEGVFTGYFEPVEVQGVAKESE